MVDHYLSVLILHCLQMINGERTTFSIYHIFKGKKSSQTIQDVHLFQLDKWFQIFPKLSRDSFNEIIVYLEKKQFIQKIEGDKVKLTQKGELYLKHKLEDAPLPKWINGWKYMSLYEIFWKRLSLLVQVSSNLIHFESEFIPIHSDHQTTDWLKSTLKKVKITREQLAENLFFELSTCLNNEATIFPNSLVLRLSGYKQIGLTPVQTAERLNMDIGYFQLQFLNVIHYLLESITNNPTHFPILKNCLDHFSNASMLTRSSSQTMKYISMGYSIDQIAAMRNLKTNTIEDHIVEIVLNNKQFSISPFLSTELESDIITTIMKLATKEIKKIRQDLFEKASYFQIRLVLAKFGDS